MNNEELHRNWDCVKHYRLDRNADKYPPIATVEALSDAFALSEELLKPWGKTMDEYLVETLGPKPIYLR